MFRILIFGLTYKVFQFQNLVKIKLKYSHLRSQLCSLHKQHDDNVFFELTGFFFNFIYFMYDNLLSDLLKKSAPSRIAITSSLLAYFSDLTVKDLNPSADYFAKRKLWRTINSRTYSASKLCLAGLTKTLASKLQGTCYLLPEYFQIQLTIFGTFSLMSFLCIKNIFLRNWSDRECLSPQWGENRNLCTSYTTRDRIFLFCIEFLFACLAVWKSKSIDLE